MNKSNKGITLIALVITIIVLLILAGITINLVMGDNGILNRAREAGKDYSEQVAREKLELALADLGADKAINTEYNETTFIDDKLTKEGFIVNGNMVLVDGWQFEIDRSVPKIINSLGKGKLNPSINLVASSSNAPDYTSSTITVTITYPGTIASIVVAGEEMIIPAPANGVYTVTKQVAANGSYGVLVKDENGDYKTASIKIIDITEDMDIYNRADMETFRDKVNSGATFAGRTVRVMSDIDLQGSSANLWIPIGNYAESTSQYFEGTFLGNNHKITNLSINAAKDYQGLFGHNKGTITGIGIESGNIIISSNQNRIGSISGYNTGTIENCYNKVNISAPTAGGVRRNYRSSL